MTGYGKWFIKYIFDSWKIISVLFFLNNEGMGKLHSEKSLYRRKNLQKFQAIHFPGGISITKDMVEELFVYGKGF